MIILAAAITAAINIEIDPSRLRVCAAPDCGQVFWDETRSRTRTWCDSRTCGNRVRVRRHRSGRPIPSD